MAIIYTMTINGNAEGTFASLAIAADFARQKARARPGMAVCIDNAQGVRVAEYTLGRDGALSAWVL